MNYLVAVNFHAFHDVAFLRKCCESVILSVAKFEKDHEEPVSIVLFNNSPRKFDNDLHSFFLTSNIQVEQIHASGNGQIINYQLDYAKLHCFDIFFRVDGDDYVFEDRFSRQALLFKQDASIDICGGGLKYKNMANNKCYTVVPRERPNTFDYLSNKYCLHPTFAIRLSSLPNNLKYWNKRIEDMKFILDANKFGLKFYNDQYLYGIYNYRSKSRNSLKARFLIFKLHVNWALAFNKLALFPAVITLLAGMVLSADHLRRIRRKLFDR